jgi:hypothetical protein
MLGFELVAGEGEFTWAKDLAAHLNDLAVVPIAP